MRWLTDGQVVVGDIRPSLHVCFFIFGLTILKKICLHCCGMLVTKFVVEDDEDDSDSNEDSDDR